MFCPNNETLNIKSSCTYRECPYHYLRMRAFIDYESPESDCSILDLPIVAEALNTSSPLNYLKTKGALRDGTKYRSLRREVDLTMVLVKTLNLLVDVLHNEQFCKECGFIDTCTNDVGTCIKRKKWVLDVLDIFNIPHTKSSLIKSNIWYLLREDKLEINSAVLLKYGRSLL